MPAPAPAAGLYDLFGDVHGHADELAALLRQLGYRRRQGAFRHAERQAIFVGDLIDRGPQIRETLALVRAMTDAGSARVVFGNHEWNALGYHTPDPDAPGEFLRRRLETRLLQHGATLAQVPDAELRSHLAWFATWPFQLELPGLRVVHAAWDPQAVAVVEDGLHRHGGISEAFLVEGHDPEALLYEALDVLLKGREMALPAGSSITDKDGTRRAYARVRWYLPPAGHTVRSYSLPHDEGLPATPLPARVAATALPYPVDAPPVFFGHYWLTDPLPAPLASNVACLDYSVAKGGYLCAYRFAGEARLRAGSFATVPSRS